MRRLCAAFWLFAAPVTHALSEEIRSIDIVTAFLDREALSGETVRITECEMTAADTSSTLCKKNGVTISIETSSMERELAKRALMQCSGVSFSDRPECTVAVGGVLSYDDAWDMLRLKDATLVD